MSDRIDYDFDFAREFAETFGGPSVGTLTVFQGRSDDDDDDEEAAERAIVNAKLQRAMNSIDGTNQAMDNLYAAMKPLVEVGDKFIGVLAGLSLAEKAAVKAGEYSKCTDCRLRCVGMI